MAREEKVWQYARQAGYRPLEDHCIVVKYAPDNLSAQIAGFFHQEYYALQLCESEMILLPFGGMPPFSAGLPGGLRGDVSLVLDYANIIGVELADELLNTIITIRTKTDTIRLSAQQKELSDWRGSGANATQYIGGTKNWHKENLDATLAALRQLGGGVQPA